MGLEVLRPGDPGPQDHDPVVGDDLDPGLAQLAEEVLAAEVDLAADGIDRQPDLDARGDLGRQRLEERRPDVARLVAVDEQVDVVRRRRDVLEDAREVAMPVEEGIDRRRDRRRERQGEVRSPDLRACDELRGAHGRRLGPDRVRVERVGRHARLAPPQVRPSSPRSRLRWPASVVDSSSVHPVESGVIHVVCGPPERATDRVADPVFATSRVDTVTPPSLAGAGHRAYPWGPRRPRTKEDSDA